MSNIFSKEESTESLIACHWKDEFLCTIWNIKWFKFPHGCILHSNIFPTSTHTPKSKLKRRSYDPDKLEKKKPVAVQKISRDQEIVSGPENLVATRRLCRDQKTWSRPKTLQKPKKRPKIEFLA